MIKNEISYIRMYSCFEKKNLIDPNQKMKPVATKLFPF